MLHVHTGRERLNKDKFLYEQIQGETLLIVPDQYTLQAERDAFFYLEKKGFLDLQVVGISRLGAMVLKEVGGGRRTLVNKQGRHMLLTKILQEENENLTVYRNYKDNVSLIEMANNFISELKQYNVSPSDLLEVADKMEDAGFIGRKLRDIHRIYQRYEELIAGKFTDTEDYIGLFAEKISQSQTIGRQTVWITGFDYFTPKNLEVIQQLRNTAKEVHIILTWDQGGTDQSLFAITGRIIEKLQPDKISQIGDEYLALRNPAIATLEQQLYAMPFKPSPLEEGITLISAANIYGEAETAACTVLQLVRDEGIRFRDILMICNDLETRGEICKRVFAEYGIPLFMDNKRDIMYSPVVRYIVSLLSVLAKGYRTEDVLGLLKTGLGPVSDEQIDDLQNYVIKYKIRGSGWKKPFEKGISDRSLGKDEAARRDAISKLEELRKTVIHPILEFGVLFKDGATVEERARILYEFLAGPAMIPQKIGALVEGQKQDGNLELAQETAQIWNIAMANLDQLVETLGTDKLSMETFCSLLSSGFEAVEVGVLPPTLDGIMLGTMQRTRSGWVKAMIVLGANDGVLPQEGNSDSILSNDEKTMLLESDIEICKADQIRMMEERLAIYRNLAKATDHLWISCAASDQQGAPIRPSSVFEKIRELFPGIPVEKDVLNRDDPMALVQSPQSTLRHLAQLLRQDLNGTPLPKEWEGVLDWYAVHDRPTLDFIAQGVLFNTKLPKIPKAQIDRLYKTDDNPDLSLSPSRLERFGRCPFAHFVRYGLRPLEEKPYEVGATEIGDIYHRCLMWVSQELSAKEGRWSAVTKEEVDSLVAQFMDREKDTFAEGILTGGNQQEYRIRRIQRVLGQAIWMMANQVRQGAIQSMGFEEEFGTGKKLRPIEVQLGEETVLIEGKIDRIDYLPDDRVQIIDYKSGTNTFDETEAVSGWKLQLMVYLRAAMEEQKQPAGVFYFHVKEPQVDASRISHEPGSPAFEAKLEDEIRKSFMLDGAVIDDPEIIRQLAGEDERTIPLKSEKSRYSQEAFMDFKRKVDEKIDVMCRELSQGNIDITPLKIKENTACKFCEYKGICMFDNRIEGCYYVLA